MPLLESRPWFEPLPDRTEEILRKYLDRSDSEGNFYFEDASNDPSVLKEAGLARIDFRDMAWSVKGRLNDRALTYFDDKKAWEDHEAAKKAAAEMDAKKARRHNWAVALVSAFIGVAAGVGGTLIAVFAGK